MAFVTSVSGGTWDLWGENIYRNSRMLPDILEGCYYNYKQVRLDPTGQIAILTEGGLQGREPRWTLQSPQVVSCTDGLLSVQIL
jgi:hypothetical protein